MVSSVTVVTTDEVTTCQVANENAEWLWQAQLWAVYTALPAAAVDCVP